MVEKFANRGRTVTFHAGPRELCPPSIRSVDVHKDYTIKGVPSGLQPRDVTGVDKQCVKHLMLQVEVARAVRSIVMLVEKHARDDKEFAVVCRAGKHRSVGVVMLMLACVYYNAVVAFHNGVAVQVARGMLDLCAMGA